VQISRAGFTIGHHSRIITAGSCFSDALGEELVRHKFPALPNPFGTVYNPLSLHRQYVSDARNADPLESSMGQRDDVHFSFDYHSSFASLSRMETLHAIRHRTSEVHAELRRCDYFFLTYGTAWVYAKNSDGRIVANCHKMPGSIFTRRLLTVDEIVDSFSKLHAHLLSLNPRLRVILTVSPVRHQRDGLENNSVSKAVLRLACYRITAGFAGTDYFPAYEIVMDELRDYRYYAGDLLHPSPEAEQYIWEKFQDRYFDNGTRNLAAQISELLRMIGHRPLLEGSREHRAFLTTVLKKAIELSAQADLSQEISALQTKLAAL
jgi:hypothetical protein